MDCKKAYMCPVTISIISFICINILFLNTPRTDKKNCFIWILKAFQDVCKNAVGCSPVVVSINFFVL